MKISFTREMFYFKVPSRKTENIKKRKAMSKIMQNLVVLMEPSDDAWNIDLKGGNMCFNRFCIDEDAAFELSGIHFLKKTNYYEDRYKGEGYKRQTTRYK